ncbi:MAG: helix-hairpin-helix domain-containing protein [Myxococcales bacterium]|nr:helix-hairpin-helix domain-containing protein [Myxococcales bacterium]
MALVVAGLILGAGGVAEAGKKKAVKLSGVVNLNTATAKQLDLLPGVGEKTAKQIIAYREKTPFKRPEELVKVKGFGKKRYEKLKPYLSVTGASTLTAREASAEGGEKVQARAAQPKR